MGSRGPTATPGGRRWKKGQQNGIVSLLQPPGPQVDVPEAPGDLPSDVRALYQQTADTLIAAGVPLLPCDAPILLGYVECIVTAQAAERHVTKHGLVRENSRGNVFPNPHLSIATKARRQALEFARQLGITPAARARLQIQLPEGEDEFSDFAIEQKLSRPRNRAPQ